MIRSLLLSITALSLAACATPTQTAQDTHAAPGARDCFQSRQINGYGIVDDHHVRVDTGPSRTYILTTSWNARDLDWTNRIGIRAFGDWICTGNGQGVQIIGGNPQQTYLVTSIVREPPPAAQGS